MRGAIVGSFKVAISWWLWMGNLYWKTNLQKEVTALIILCNVKQNSTELQQESHLHLAEFLLNDFALLISGFPDSG